MTSATAAARFAAAQKYAGRALTAGAPRLARQDRSDVAALPTLHREAGYTFRFYAADSAEPPHVHVTGNGGEAKLWLVSGLGIVRGRRYTAEQRKKIVQITEEHRVEWLSAWRRFFGKR